MDCMLIHRSNKFTFTSSAGKKYTTWTLQPYSNQTFPSDSETVCIRRVVYRMLCTHVGNNLASLGPFYVLWAENIHWTGGNSSIVYALSRFIGLTLHVTHWKLLVVGRVAAIDMHRDINSFLSVLLLIQRLMWHHQSQWPSLCDCCAVLSLFLCVSFFHNAFVRPDPDSLVIPATIKSKACTCFVLHCFCTLCWPCRMNSWAVIAWTEKRFNPCVFLECCLVGRSALRISDKRLLGGMRRVILEGKRLLMSALLFHENNKEQPTIVRSQNFGQIKVSNELFIGILWSVLCHPRCRSECWGLICWGAGIMPTNDVNAARALSTVSGCCEKSRTIQALRRKICVR